MIEQTKLRSRIILTVILLYFVPIALLSVYSIITVPLAASWSLLAAGLLISAAGSIALIISFWYWEGGFWSQLDALAQSKATMLVKKNTESISAPQNLPSLDSKLEALMSQIQSLESKNTQFQKEKMNLEAEVNKLMHELNHFHHNQSTQTTQKNDLLAEYATMVETLRSEISGKNNKINEMQSTITDLNYELKTLLQVSDFGTEQEQAPSKPREEIKINLHTIDDLSHFPPPYPPEQVTVQKPPTSTSPYVHTAPKQEVRVSDEISDQLKRCLEIAQKMTGSAHFGAPSHSALEERRFFDSLADEQTSVIMVYSLKDERPLFISKDIKELTGWTSEKFLQDFNVITQESGEDWREALLQLTKKQEVSVGLKMKNRSNTEQHVDCVMSLIPAGIFKHYVVAILF
jgi:peptidoglycan hydrolase CwlO-like protein